MLILLCSDQTEIKALPFQLSSKDLAFNITAGFQPTLKLGAGARIGEEIAIQGGVGIVMDLPSIVHEIKPVHNADASCVKVTSGFGNDYINVIPSWSIGAHAFAQLEASVLNDTLVNIGEEYPIIQSNHPLPTSCFLWSEKAHGLVDPQKVSGDSTDQTGGTSGGVVASVAIVMLSLVAGFCAIVL